MPVLFAYKRGEFMTTIEYLALPLYKRVFYKFIDRFSDADFISDASDFRTMRQSVVKTIIALPEYHRFSKGIFSWIGFKTKWLEYEIPERTVGESKFPIKKLLSNVFNK